MAYGAFSEWGVVQAKHALPVPVIAPQIVALLTSGLTASIGAPHATLLQVYQFVCTKPDSCHAFGCRFEAKTACAA